MNIEELENEAKEYADWFWGASPSMMKALAEAYIKGAEPREKRIEELEAKNAGLEERCEISQDEVSRLIQENKLLGERCIQLLKDKSNLTDKCKELAAQIKKMEQNLDNARENANKQEQWEIYSVLNDIFNYNNELKLKIIEPRKKRIAELEAQIKTKDNQLAKARAIMNIAIEGIKYWGIVGGNERPLEKQAERLFNLFLDKSEQFLNSEVEK